MVLQAVPQHMVCYSLWHDIVTTAYGLCGWSLCCPLYGRECHAYALHACSTFSHAISMGDTHCMRTTVDAETHFACAQSVVLATARLSD